METKDELAEESYKTKKVREKLKTHYKSLDEKVTKHAINRKISEIHQWIARHAYQRVTLKSKNISLFDENQNTADVSKKLESIISRLKTHSEKKT